MLTTSDWKEFENYTFWLLKLIGIHKLHRFEKHLNFIALACAVTRSWRVPSRALQSASPPHPPSFSPSLLIVFYRRHFPSFDVERFTSLKSKREVEYV